MRDRRHSGVSSLALGAVALAMTAVGSAAQAQFGPQGPQYVSPEVNAETGAVTLRIAAPNATEVLVGGTDIMPDPRNPPALTKGEDGVWSVTLTPPRGTYRYTFRVDGVETVDTRNPLVSERVGDVQSLVHIDGSTAGEDLRDVPHGSVSEVIYSSPLFANRRMHVYLPPGYETNDVAYPVFYLLHGAGDSDDAWSTVGRAGVILDNLIADGRATPMIVVMTDGHTPPIEGQDGIFGSGPPGTGAFERDFLEGALPYIESHYRVVADREHRAIAGLSMGGFQTLNISLTRPELFSAVGVYSSGIFSQDAAATEAAYGPLMENAKTFDTLYFAWGREDFILDTITATLAMLDEHGVSYIRNETGGGHTWENWRHYLHDFAPRLFK